MQIVSDFKAAHIKPKAWAQVLGYRPDEQMQLRQLGEMYAVMSLESTIDFDLANVGNLLFDELQASYFGDNTSGDIKQFEQAVLAVKQRLAEILEREPELSEQGIDLQAAVTVVKGEIAYLAVVGEAKIFVQRGDDFAEIGAALLDAEQDGFLRSGSMYLNSDDRLLISTNHLLESNAESNVSNTLRNFNMRNVTVLQGAALALGVDVEVPTEDPEIKSLPAQSLSVNEVDDFMDNEDEPEPTPEDIRDWVEDPLDEDEVGVEDDYEEEDYEEGPGLLEKAKGLALSAVAKGKVFKDKAKQKWEEKQGNDLASEEDAWREDVDNVSFSPVERSSRLPSLPRVDSERLRPYIAKMQPFVATAAFKASQGWDFLKDKTADVLGRKGLDRHTVYQRGGKTGPNWKVLAVVGLVVLIALVLGVRKLSQDQQRAEFVAGVEKEIKKLENELEEREVEVSTVSIGNASGKAKQDVIEKIDGLLTSANELLETDVEKERVQKLISAVQGAKDQVLNIRAFTEPQLIIDLGVKFEDTKPVDIAYSKGNIYVLDQGKNTIYKLGLNLNSQASTLTSKLSKPYLMDVDEDGDLVVIEDKNQGSVVNTVSLANGAVTDHPGLSKSQMGTLVAMDVWSNAAMYSVNAGKKIIMKQDNVGGGYQLPDESNPWRRDENFANARDIEVDYWAFVLIEGKGVRRYLAGEPADLSLEGLIEDDMEALKSAKALAITTRRFYVADPANKRVLVFERDLQNSRIFRFKEQFIYRGSKNIFSEITDIVVNPSTGHIFVLDGTRVIRLDG